MTAVTTSEPKLIVAIDFGTTFSGVAFVSCFRRLIRGLVLTL